MFAMPFGMYVYEVQKRLDMPAYDPGEEEMIRDAHVFGATPEECAEAIEVDRAIAGVM